MDRLMIKNLLTLILVLSATGTTFGSFVLYADDFDNDGLTTNAGVGGGLTQRSLRGGHHFFQDNGNLQFTTTGNTNFQNRVIAFSDNTFQSTLGFEVTVDSFQTNFGGASSLAFGLISDDTDFTTYTNASPSFNPFEDPSVEGFGVRNDTSNLNVSDGSSTTILDSGAPFTLGQVITTVIRFANNGSGGASWSWSVDGVSRGSGTIATFDFTENFHFVAFGQDDQGNKRIESVTVEGLMSVPEPNSLILFASLLPFAVLKRKKLPV